MISLPRSQKTKIDQHSDGLAIGRGLQFDHYSIPKVVRSALLGSRRATLFFGNGRHLAGKWSKVSHQLQSSANAAVPMKTLLSRRRFLAHATALTSTLPFFAGKSGPAFAAIENRVDVRLTVKEVDGRATYNGLACGPTIVMDAGETLDVHLINELPALNDDCTDNPNAFHGRNTTNLHTHGLHVSPTTDSTGRFDADNVFVSVVPRDQYVPCAEICGVDVKKNFRWGENKFRFETRSDHPTGTFWYHAHKHGSTFQQVGDGLVGPLIIRDRPGEMPAYIAQAEEKILMIMNQGLVLVDPQGGGDFDPVIHMRPGSVQRWRVINAQAAGNSYAYIRTNVPGLEIYQIAFDGLTLERRVAVDQDNDDEPWSNPAALAPGNRTDFIVRVPRDAEEQTFSLPVIRSVKELLELSGAISNNLQIDISGAPIDALWSDDPTLPGPGLVPIARPDKKRQVTFSAQFSVDGEKYTGEVKHRIPLGAEEEWTIHNDTGGVHAFHIHVNPFFVTHINGEELAEDDPRRRWQDTIGIPSNDDGPGSITCRSRFETFAGKFVIHCHILRHEDLGMMQTVEVVK